MPLAITPTPRNRHSGDLIGHPVAPLFDAHSYDLALRHAQKET
jgi:hypothetical protein